MATLTSGSPTLLDVAKSLDPDGSVAIVAELLHQTNDILTDMTWLEGNLPTGHVVTVRTGLPQGTWRRLYGRISQTKSTREQITESIGMLEDYSEVDATAAELNGNTNQYLLDEASAHIEGLSQQLAETIMFGNVSVTPERFEGFAPRYNDLSAPNADNIIDAGGTGTDNRSIWLVVWGRNSVFGIYPKGSTAGIKVNNKGAVTSETTAGKLEVYRMHFSLRAGLCVRDWRYAVRICNIDKSLLTADATTGAALHNLMFDAVSRIPSLSAGQPVFYMPRDVKTKLDQQAANGVKNSTLTIEQLGGVPTLMFQGIPVRRVDRLAVDEARVT